nr:hypothetical protein Iba_chr10fCG10540 [Ipomoea batatas]
MLRPRSRSLSELRFPVVGGIEWKKWVSPSLITSILDSLNRFDGNAPALVQLRPVQFEQTLSRFAMDHERRTSSVLDKVFFHSTRALPCSVLSDDVVSQGTEELGLGYPNCCWIKVSLRVTAEDCIVIPEYLLSAN